MHHTKIGANLLFHSATLLMLNATSLTLLMMSNLAIMPSNVIIAWGWHCFASTQCSTDRTTIWIAAEGRRVNAKSGLHSGTTWQFFVAISKTTFYKKWELNYRPFFCLTEKSISILLPICCRPQCPKFFLGHCHHFKPSPCFLHARGEHQKEMGRWFEFIHANQIKAS